MSEIYPNELENAYSAYMWNQVVLYMDHRFNFEWCLDHYNVKRMEFIMLIIERQEEEIRNEQGN